MCYNAIEFITEGYALLFLRGEMIMKITKYAITDLYGYGFFMKNSYFQEFYTCMYIRAYSKTTSLSSQYFNWEPERFCAGRRLGFVFDDDTETWREYFSGIRVALAVSTHSYSKDFNVDKDQSASGILTIALPYRECTATEFSEYVSSFTDNQIRQIVAEIRTLNRDAGKWKAAFDTTVEALKNERARKESGILDVESRLASSFGKYGSDDVSTQEPCSARQGSNQNNGIVKHLLPTPTQEDTIRWISQGRCAFCGGEFKGIFSKVCKSCGKAKNYR